MIQFTKMQATGNDFVVVDAARLNYDWPELAAAMCDRHFGVGSDGLLLVLPSEKADARMRMFNPDGSEAEACGNGLRCFIKYIVEAQAVKDGKVKRLIETKAGVRSAVACISGGSVKMVSVTMGRPEFALEKIPVGIEAQQKNKSVMFQDYPLTVERRKLLLNFVSMGNPHAVHFARQPVDDFPLGKIGPLVEHHPIFPKRTNFEIVNVVNRKQIKARVWERGAGETLACGSGACAIAVAARIKGYVDEKVDIEVKGGALTIEWDGQTEVALTGPAETVFTGIWKKGNK